jgi:hypothetical protein
MNSGFLISIHNSIYCFFYLYLFNNSIEKNVVFSLIKFIKSDYFKKKIIKKTLNFYNNVFKITY